jgi:hypothetical protein
MSTSPSWFDQEKFSRLVKKVGPKTVTEPLPSVSGTDPDNRAASSEGLASTARISLVSKPPSLLSEQRALPTLPRRTAPLPSIKALFPYPTPPSQPPSGEPSIETSPGGEAGNEPSGETAAPEADPNLPFGPEGDELAGTWHKMSLLNEELARAIHERDQAINEGQILRDQLRKADEARENKDDGSAASSEDLARVTKERDAAIAELQSMREQAIKKLDPAKELRATTQSQELTLLTEERDRARKEYSEIRKQYEDLKQEQTARAKTGSVRMDSEKQLDQWRQKLADRDREISELKANAAAAASAAAETRVDEEKPNAEITSLREQIARLKDEASIAQRGLALSQKALHETRDTLREATEGTSLSRHNFDNLKNECAILSQQNTVLQAQNDQLTRDLAVAKSKLTTRL